MKIIVTESEGFSKLASQNLSSLGELILTDIKDRKSFLAQTKEATILFVRLRHFIDKEIINNAPQLKYILTATTGLDHIDVDYFEARGGRVVSLKGEYEFLSSIPSTAEHTWGLLLALMRNTSKAFDDVKHGFWRRDLFKGNNLRGKKIGILGLGRVGSQVAKYADAFEMEIGFYDIEEKRNTTYKCFNYPKDLFSWADILCIHIPLNNENIHFINKGLIDCLKQDAILINTSRGAVIDETYLCQQIESNTIGGYATDVIENEIDLKDNLSEIALINLAKKGYNVLITPHIAGATYESMAMTEDFVTAKLMNYLNEK